MGFNLVEQLFTKIVLPPCRQYNLSAGANQAGEVVLVTVAVRTVLQVETNLEIQIVVV